MSDALLGLPGLKIAWDLVIGIWDFTVGLTLVVKRLKGLYREEGNETQLEDK